MEGSAVVILQCFKQEMQVALTELAAVDLGKKSRQIQEVEVVD